MNTHEAKTHLSRLLERAAKGEEIIIAKAGKPAVLAGIRNLRIRRYGGDLGGVVERLTPAMMVQAQRVRFEHSGSSVLRGREILNADEFFGSLTRPESSSGFRTGSPSSTASHGASPARVATNA